MSQPIRHFRPVSLTTLKPNHPVEHVAFFATDGTPLIFGAAPLASAVKMTAYSVPSGSNILATDSVLDAIHKLDVRLRNAGTPL